MEFSRTNISVAWAAIAKNAPLKLATAIHESFMSAPERFVGILA
jgi:hypothetical protein